jgi:hypothetical protein
MPKMTLEEMESKITDLTSKYEAEVKEKEDAKKKNAAAKCAECGSTDHMTENHPEKEAKGGEAKKARKAAFKKHMKAAMDEPDEEKKARHMKEAMKHYKASDEEEDKEDEEKEALKAQLTVLEGMAKKPAMEFLTAAYKDKVDEATLKEYTANWNKLSFTELNAKVKEVAAFVGNIVKKTETETPIGFGTFQLPFMGSTVKDEYIASLEKKTDAELFK